MMNHPQHSLDFCNKVLSISIPWPCTKKSSQFFQALQRVDSRSCWDTLQCREHDAVLVSRLRRKGPLKALLCSLGRDRDVWWYLAVSCVCYVHQKTICFDSDNLVNVAEWLNVYIVAGRNTISTYLVLSKYRAWKNAPCASSSFSRTCSKDLKSIQKYSN